VLTEADGVFLVSLARRAVETYLKHGYKIEPPEDTPKHLMEKMGVFVTIERVYFVKGQRRKELRGCIGYPEPILPLAEATIDSALNAAFNDPRFNPLKEGELNKVIFELSVLTPPKLLSVSKPEEYPKIIRVGRDGLIVERAFYKGLLLPQVAVEWGWDEETFLAEVCLKAGLPPDAWLLKGTKIYVFQAEIFAELEPNGHVIKMDISKGIEK